MRDNYTHPTYKSLVLLTFFAATLTAQSGSGVVGTVNDPQGRAIQDVRLRLFRADNTASLNTSTNSRGEYQFEEVAPGLMLLEIQKDGFRTETDSVTIAPGNKTHLDIKMQLAGVNETVVVTADNEAQALDEVTKSVSTISHEEITNRNDYSIATLLTTVPGVQVFNEGGPGQYTRITIRGLPDSAGAILVDGLRFRDAATIQEDATSFLPSLNVVDADHIEVLRGSASSLYGTDAIGGAVNIVTDPGGGPTHGGLQVEGGNLGLVRTRGSIAGGAFGDKLAYSAGLSHLNVMSGVDGHDANRSTGLQGFARYYFTPKMSLSGRFWGSDDFVELNNSPTSFGIPFADIPNTLIVPAIPLSPGGVQTLLAGGTPNYGNATYIPNANDPDSRAASRFENAAFIFRDIVAPAFNWQASYQIVHTERSYQNGPEGIGYQPPAADYSRYAGTISTTGLRGSYQVTPWLSLIGGYEFEQEKYFDNQNNNLPAPNLVYETTHASQDSNAAYFAAQASLLNRRLQISLSGRVQYFQLNSPQFNYGGTYNPYVSVAGNAPRALTGDASIAYLFPRSNTKFRAHVGNSYREPGLYERFGAGFYNNPENGSVLFTPYGNPALAPDRYNSVDGGIDQYLFNNRVRVSATMFYIRIAQLIEFDSSGIVNPLTDPYGRSEGYINGAGGVSRGAELSVEVRPTRSLTLSSSYTYTNAGTDQDSEVPGIYQAFDTPKHMLTFVGTKQWGNRLTTTVDLFHYSSYLDPYVGYLQAYLFPGYTVTNLNASYRFWQNENKSARFYGKVDNLFNRTYYVIGNVAPKTTFVTGINYTF